MLSSLFTWAGKNGHCKKGHNPAAATEVDRVAEEGRERFLTAEEMTRLGDAIRQAETVGLPVNSGDDPKKRRVIIDQFAAAAIRLLLLTGCRLREILHLEWSRVDFERGVINLAEAKRGRRPVILNAPALQILSELPRIGRFVIASTVEDKPRADIKRAWQRVREAAGLPTFAATICVTPQARYRQSSGLGLQITGALLGHKSVQATQRYAHLANDPLRRAAERVGSEIAGHLGLVGEDADNVVELKREGSR